MTADSARSGTACVSVVITNHNYERFVADAVRSATAQRCGGVEIVVVDDGSTDGSRHVLDALESSVSVIFQDNGGQASAFNTGFAATTAPIVIFVDADDRIDDDLADRLVDAFEDHDVARVQFPLRVIDPSGRVTGDEVPPSGVELASGDVRRALTSFPDDITWQPTTGNAFRREVLAQIMPMPCDEYRICADYYLSNLTPLYGTVAVLDRFGGDYRVHGDNGHYATAWTLDRLRADIVRTSITHQHLIERCRALELRGLPDDPHAVRSVVATAHRLISKRFDPARHPIDADRRTSLTCLGLRAAAGRFDIGVGRRLVMGGWFIALAMVPRRFVGAVASKVRPVVADVESC